ncbi:MAG: hypothetical protein LQ342_005327 [Letrouitia transgressa]|nr:MAG: hypothetical protein LQ342_005327 [Letrouitia transgressa]
MIVPGSGLVRSQAESEGLDKIFEDAGFEWREAGCSMCLGMNPDILSPKERCGATSNRNCEGRQGAGGRTHLMYPVMAAAAALIGKLADVRDLAKENAAPTKTTQSLELAPEIDVDSDEDIERLVDLPEDDSTGSGKDSAATSGGQTPFVTVKGIAAPALQNTGHQATLEMIANEARAGREVEVDLINQRVNDASGMKLAQFEIEEFRKHCLINGLDDISLTMQMADKVKKFEQQRTIDTPWLDGTGYMRIGQRNGPTKIEAAPVPTINRDEEIKEPLDW